MKINKQQYIDQIRSNTVYPTYRRFVEILTVVGYVLAGLFTLITLLGSLEAFREGQYLEGFEFFVGALIGGVIIVFISRLWKEAALLLADIADSVTDANSRFSFGQ